MVTENLGMGVTLDRVTILLGTQSPKIYLCCILGKSYLYFCKTQQTITVIEKLITQIINTRIIEKNIAEKTNKMQKSNTKWCTKN